MFLFISRDEPENETLGGGKPGFFYGYVIVLAAFCIITLIWGSYNSFAIFFKPISIEFGWTRAATAAAVSIAELTFGLTAIIVGKLNDRFGPRLVVTTCGFFLGLGYLLTSQVNAIWQLYLFFGAIVGIGLSGSVVPLFSTIARWFVKRRGTMTGLVSAGIGVGTLIMPIVAAWLITTIGWRDSFIALGIIVLVLITLAAQFMQRDPAKKGQVPYGENELPQDNLNIQTEGLSLAEALPTGQFWMALSMFFCYLFTLGGIFLHIVPYATDIGIAPTVAASILSIVGGASIAGRVVMGGISDRIGIKLSLIISFIMFTASLFWLQIAREVWMLYLFAVFYGFPYGAVGALISPMIAELFGLRAHGAILGVVLAGGEVGAAVGAVVVGHLFDISGNYALAFWLCVIFSVAGLALVALLRPIQR